MRLTIRNTFITLFTLAWILIFHYESLRAFYLSPWAGPLPKTPFLFPPAGWIMFYRVEDSWATAEVYGVRKDTSAVEGIDPHRIFITNFVGFDNIRRNIMANVIRAGHHLEFCRYLRRKFPEYEKFGIFLSGYPSLTREKPRQKRMRMLYEC